MSQTTSEGKNALLDEGGEKKYQRVKIEDATTPTAGINNIYINDWWIVTPEEEILFFRNSSAQCNHNRELAESIRDRIYFGFEVRQLPAVFRPVNPQDYC